MIRLRKAADRGGADHGWLNTKHTFSFADYYDERHMGFGALRVINDDRVKPGHGFPTHGHRDMEIVSYVLDGALEHKDSLGTGSTIRPGDVQRMSAGTGVLHSEYNPSKTEGVRFLQIWILPEKRNLQPGYEQKTFGDERKGKLRLVASPDGAEGSVTVRQDVRLYATVLEPGQSVSHAFAEGRRGWVQIARGAIDLNGQAMAEGDGAALESERELKIVAREPSEVLVFDLS